MSDYLPPELLMDITTRLPVDAILRCTSVCKTWYSLITSPAFISLHLNRSIAKNINTPKLLLRHCVKEESITEKYTVRSDDLNFDTLSAFTIPFNKSNVYYRVVGISNGLVCLSDDNIGGKHSIVLWNPHIRKFLKLPTPIVTYQSHGGFEHTLGFGINPATNDFMIIRVVYLMDSDDDHDLPLVELYQLSTGSWRDISPESLYSFMVLWRSPQAILNGVVHWVGCRRDSRAPVIVAFDMETQVFGSMVMPPGVETLSGMGGCCRVAVYEDSLCLLDNVKYHCHVWVMEEYGKAETWTKKFTIDLDLWKFRKPFGSRGNGDFLMATERGELVSYDPSTRQAKNLGVHGYQHYEFEADTFFADSFVESLVLLGGVKDFRDLSAVSEEIEDIARAMKKVFG